MEKKPTGNSVQQPVLGTVEGSWSDDGSFWECIPNGPLTGVLGSVESGSRVGGGIEVRDVNQSRDSDIRTDFSDKASCSTQGSVGEKLGGSVNCSKLT